MRSECVAFEYVRPGNRRTTFDALLMHADHEVVIVSHEARPSKPLYHLGVAAIEPGYQVVWFLFQGQPYDIGRFYRPDGAWTGYYVDILEPVHWTGSDPPRIAPLIDLALDLWIAPDGSWEVLDELELEDYVHNGELTPAQGSQARTVLDELRSAVDEDRFPPEIVRTYDRAVR